MTILDTNVVSEVLKPAPSPEVMDWLSGLPREAAYITSITQAELLLGVEFLPAGRRRSELAYTIGRILEDEFKGHILPFDDRAAGAYAKIVSQRRAQGRPIGQSDAMIASISQTWLASLATRNEADFEGCGVTIINPWFLQP